MGRGFSSTWDWAGNEAFIAGQLAFDWATPRQLHDHLPWFTAAFLAVRAPALPQLALNLDFIGQMSAWQIPAGKTSDGCQHLGAQWLREKKDCLYAVETGLIACAKPKVAVERADPDFGVWVCSSTSSRSPSWPAST